MIQYEIEGMYYWRFFVEINVKNIPFIWEAAILTLKFVEKIENYKDFLSKVKLNFNCIVFE